MTQTNPKTGKKRLIAKKFSPEQLKARKAKRKVQHMQEGRMNAIMTLTALEAMMVHCPKGPKRKILKRLVKHGNGLVDAFGDFLKMRGADLENDARSHLSRDFDKKFATSLVEDAFGEES